MGMSYAARRNQLTVKTFDRISLNYKKAAQAQLRLREKSPEPYPDNQDEREEIYLKLIQSTSSSGLNEKTVFHGAPTFFKKKIGLKDTYVRDEPSSCRPPIECKSSPSLFRLQNCSGCSSSTSLQQSDGGDGGKLRRESPQEALASRRTSREECRASMEQKHPNNYGTSALISAKDLAKRPEWKSVWNKPSSPTLAATTSAAKLKTTGSKRTMTGRIRPIETEDVEMKDVDLENHKNKDAFGTEFKGTPKVKAQPPLPKQIRTVFVVNGNVVSFKEFGSERFTNWFAQADPSNPSKRRGVLRQLDFSGFTNREISMKVFEGRKFVIEAERSGVPEKKVKFSFRLPDDLEVESLFLSRDTRGYLIIEKKVD